MDHSRTIEATAMRIPDLSPRYHRPGPRHDSAYAPVRDLLRTLFKESGLTQATLGRRVGVTQPYISQLLSGRERPSAALAQRLDEALGAGGRFEARWIAYELLAERRPDGRGVDTVTVADSRLAVVKSILLGWNLEGLLTPLGFDVRYDLLPWSDNILSCMDDGRVHFAVYNLNRTRAHLQEHADCPIVILGRVGRSMGGRNFYVLGHRRGRWADMGADDFLNNPAGARIAVSQSDMRTNLVRVLSDTGGALDDHGVSLVDHPGDAGLEVFGFDRDLLLVGDQNVRVAAKMYDRDFFELLNLDLLGIPTHRYLIEAATNVALTNRETFGRITDACGASVFCQLVGAFVQWWMEDDVFDKHLRELCEHTLCCDGGLVEPRHMDLARSILYETYRFGEPTP